MNVITLLIVLIIGTVLGYCLFSLLTANDEDPTQRKGKK